MHCSCTAFPQSHSIKTAPQIEMFTHSVYTYENLTKKRPHPQRFDLHHPPIPPSEQTDEAHLKIRLSKKKAPRPKSTPRRTIRAALTMNRSRAAAAAAAPRPLPLRSSLSQDSRPSARRCGLHAAVEQVQPTTGSNTVYYYLLLCSRQRPGESVAPVKCIFKTERAQCAHRAIRKLSDAYS